MSLPIAHTRPDGVTHPLEEHLRDTGERARLFATPFGGGDAAFVAGLWHDLGKYSKAFQNKLQGALDSALNDEDIAAQDAASQRVDHSTAGALLAQERGGSSASPLAFVIAGHHAGLASPSALKERFHRKHALLAEAVDGGVPSAILDAKGPALPEHVRARTTPDNLRALEFWTRLLYSALVDADFLDTERFLRASAESERVFSTTLDVLAGRLAERLDGLQREAPDTEVNRVRREVRAACVARAADAPGRFTLTVPTGGGKTLAAMAFALEHARRHGMQRVIVAVPYTAILEQNAAVYREILGDDAIVEHHSNLDPDKERYRNKLASENWDAPVVVTTTVQLFESMFARRSSRCRKLHRLARSVIVLDEAQSLPPALLPTILDGITELTDHYGATVVSCTATQPALKHHPRRFPCGLKDMREIVPSDLGHFARLKRVVVEMPEPAAPPTPWAELARRVAAESDALAIVHLRKDARTLCDALDGVLGDTSTVHLSALMCPVHREEVLRALKRRKKNGEAVRVVSTQLVEAGVDLDFARVFRALAGFDAIAQAAGRCNREGKLAQGTVTVYLAETEPPPGILASGLGVARALLAEVQGIDVLAPDAQRLYFERLYKNLGAHRDSQAVQTARERMDYVDTAARFVMIDDRWAAPVVIPWGEGQALVAEALAAPSREGLSRRLLRRMQRYTVSVSRRAHDALVARSILRRVDDTVTVLPSLAGDVYSPRFGLDLDRLGAGILDAGALIIG